MRLRTLFDRYALIIAMMIGAVGYQWFRHLDECMPTLIFLMLFFTFCKINPLDLRLRAWHAIVLVCQLALTAGIYYGLHYGLQLVANTWGLTHTDARSASTLKHTGARSQNVGQCATVSKHTEHLF